ncbi:Rhodanese-like domain-containing protein [Chytriomyces cf. hyalinus JEL632]|nr:Rhodanese-like domain-containing protein [Chytriomyces cf. hyalinus JEL632]
MQKGLCRFFTTAARTPAPSLVTPSWVHSALSNGASDHGRIRILDASFHVPLQKRTMVQIGDKLSARDRVRRLLGLELKDISDSELESPEIRKYLREADDEVRNAVERNARQEFAETRIQSATFLDLGSVRDVLKSLPLSMPSAEDFSGFMNELGVLNSDHVVLYDSVGVHTSPRAWWLFKAMGHENISIIDGGLPAWMQEGFSTESSTQESTPSSEPDGTETYTATLQTEMVTEFQQMYTTVIDFAAVKVPVIIDCRSRDRHLGIGVEHVGSIKKLGTIPGSKHIHWTEFMDQKKSKTGATFTTVKHPMDIIRAFKEQDRNIDLDRDIIVFGHDGVSASVVCFCLHLLGKTSGVSLYDGGWMEWASRDGSPITQKFF